MGKQRRTDEAWKGQMKRKRCRKKKRLGALPRENDEVEREVRNIPVRSVPSKHERKLLKQATCSTSRGQKLVALSLEKTGMRSAWIVSSASKKTRTELRTKDIH